MNEFKNPLEAVQLIPIFNYINILSDFLFIERYLREDDQTKQIPIVNGLYDYLKDNENNNTKKIEFIRNLLRGSDLYGAKDQENFDLTFINAMFEHIITSLVFDKYGNIYGFLAKMFLKVENLQINEVLSVIITSLENEKFDNEYGGPSMLSIYAAGRIFNDIISPLFPRTKNNIGLLSLDYIYAQAGLIFLRAGQVNDVYFYYYHYSKSLTENLADENLFQEYLVTGHAIEKLIKTDESNQQMLKAFALPALTHYILKSKFLFTFENIGKLISRPIFWQMAYRQLFQYTTKMFDDIEFKFRNDFKYSMHIAISSFQSCSSLAERTLKEYCPNTEITGENSKLTFYVNYPTSFACKFNGFLPDPRENFRGQIHNITKVYETCFFKVLKDSLSNNLLRRFDYESVIIKILVPNKENYVDTKYLFYDLLEVYTPKNITFQYYVVNYEKYDVTINKESDGSENYSKEIDLYFQKLKSLSMPLVLKTTDESTTNFLENLVKYKKLRLEGQLEILDDCQGENRELKNNWWQEFGLWLSPYEECFLANNDHYKNFCGTNSFKLLNTYRNKSISPIIVDKNTYTLLSSLETSIESVLLRNESIKAVDEIITKKYIHSVLYSLNEEIFQDITRNIKKPEFYLSVNIETLGILERIIITLKEKTGFSYASILSRLSKLLILKSNYYRQIGTIGNNNNRLIYVNTLNNRSDTGYGYKFMFLSANITELAYLRTDYDFKDERLFLPIPILGRREKKYLAISNLTFEYEPDYNKYEINYKLRKRLTRLVFTGISIQTDDQDENCSNDEYFEKKKKDNCCRRRHRFAQSYVNKKEAIEFVVEKTRKSEEEVLNVLEKYPFFNSVMLAWFINEWSNSNFSKEPPCSQSYTIENYDLLTTLLYDSSFEKHNISDFDGEFRIGSFYSKEERSEIEEDAKLESIIESYNSQKARFALTFHDYYAIRNYATKGYMRITRDTNEAKLMKLALYKLAIRQFDDPDEAFNLKLFRVETKPIAFTNTTFRDITLQKFTHTYTSSASAGRFAAYPFKGYTNILYEMIFTGPYARVKIEQFYNEKEENVILLPGSKFSIVGSSILKIGGLGSVLKLKLMFQNTSNNKLQCLRNIMNEIALINF